jgi:hypothetical protein
MPTNADAGTDVPSMPPARQAVKIKRIIPLARRPNDANIIVTGDIGIGTISMTVLPSELRLLNVARFIEERPHEITLEQCISDVGMWGKPHAGVKTLQKRAKQFQVAEAQAPRCNKAAPFSQGLSR